MKVSWILMHGRSVRNLIDGRKSQTRRVLKPQPRIGRYGDGSPIEYQAGQIGTGPYCVWTPERGDQRGSDIPLHRNCMYRLLRACPYGQPGDLLWVRETHYVWDAGYIDGTGKRIDYRATEPDAPCTWTPSIYMPRWASRITLRLTDVRVERVQEISTEDCNAEGVEPDGNKHGYLGAGYRPAFRELWEHTNGTGAWDRNDWVWVLCFDVIHENVDRVLEREAA